MRAKYGAPLQWIRDHVDHAGEECLLWPFGLPRAKLRREFIPVISHRAACGEPHALIALDYTVSRRAVSLALSGANWA